MPMDEIQIPEIGFADSTEQQIPHSLLDIAIEESTVKPPFGSLAT